MSVNRDSWNASLNSKLCYLLCPQSGHQTDNTVLAPLFCPQFELASIIEPKTIKFISHFHKAASPRKRWL